MKLERDRARELFAAARVTRLASVRAPESASVRVPESASVRAPGGTSVRPHLVPIVFALDVDEDVVYSAIDAKPKTTMDLQRLANIDANPAVTLLVDHYEEEWERLWWVRADGLARVVTGSEAQVGLECLVSRYPQYRVRPPPGPVLAITIEQWTGWAAARRPDGAG